MPLFCVAPEGAELGRSAVNLPHVGLSQPAGTAGGGAQPGLPCPSSRAWTQLIWACRSSVFCLLQPLAVSLPPVVLIPSPTPRAVGSASAGHAGLCRFRTPRLPNLYPHLCSVVTCTVAMAMLVTCHLFRVTPSVQRMVGEREREPKRTLF